MQLNKLVLVVVVLWTTCLFVTCKERKDSTEKKDTKKKKDEKDDGDKSSSKGTTAEEDDYDTTQGYPILYPETHMMSQLKRNVTGVSNNVTSLENDDESRFKNKSSNSLENSGGKCTKSVDLLFVLDSSESVKYSNWKIVIDFVKDLANRFTLDTARVGIIRYASEAEVALPLTRFNDTKSRNSAIDDIFYKTGGTRTDIALKKAAEVLHAEDQRSQVLMLVTDGPTNRLEINRDHFVEGKDLVAGPAYKLKQAGVAIFTIGVEPDSETPEEVETMKEEMRVISSEPTKQHLFLSDGYHELERKVDYVSKAACVVNGGWSVWSEFSPCSVTCGFGTKVRMRTCSNPSPENNGADCTGTRVETEECDLGPCTVNDSPVVKSPVGNNTKQGNDTLSAVIVNSSTTVIKNQTNVIKPASENSTKANNSTSNTSGTSNKTHTNETSDIKEKKASNAVVGGCYEGVEDILLNDSQFNASSIYSHDTDDEYVKKEYAPPNARLNNQVNGGGWCAEHKFAATGDKNQFLQFDLGKQMTVDAVATQGSHLLDNWVTSYNLRYSDDAMSWEFYGQNPLEGNKNRGDVKKHFLNPPIVARYIQVNPIEWNEQDGSEKHDICLRAGLFKCKEAPSAHQRRGITRSRVESRHPNLNTFEGVIMKEHESHVRSRVPSVIRTTYVGYRPLPTFFNSSSSREKRHKFPRLHHNHLRHEFPLVHRNHLSHESTLVHNMRHDFSQNSNALLRHGLPLVHHNHLSHDFRPFHRNHPNHEVSQVHQGRIQLHKRILSKVRKVAKNIMRRIRKPARSFF